jgi:hypothetical protein
MQAFKCLNPENAATALRAFFTARAVRKQEQLNYRCFFALDQLWIKECMGDGLWAVVDSNEPGNVEGFRFISI